MARILHVCASSDFAQYVDRILPAIDAAGHEVHFASSPGPEPARLLDTGRIHLHTIPIERSIDPRADLRCLSELVRLIRKVEPDLVHAHTPKGGLLGMLAAAQTGVRARLYQVHGVRYETARGARRTLLQSCERLAASLAHRVLCVSPSVRERLVRDSIAPARKCVVFGCGSAQGIDVSNYDPEGYGVDADALRTRWGIPETSPIVAYLGRLARDKGVATLVEAWPLVLKRLGEAQLILAGSLDPTDAPDLKAAREFPSIHITGHIDDPRPLLRAASLVVVPSFREGLPQTILEAALMETPVVATRVTGNIDALQEGRSGLLVEPRDPAALARTVVELLENPNQQRAMGSWGREDVEMRFPAQPIFANTLALYDEMLR